MYNFLSILSIKPSVLHMQAALQLLFVVKANPYVLVSPDPSSPKLDKVKVNLPSLSDNNAVPYGISSFHLANNVKSPDSSVNLVTGSSVALYDL